MSFEILKNGSEHDCQKVDAVLATLEFMQQSSMRARWLLVDLHILSVPGHPKAADVRETHKAELQQFGLLDDNGHPPLIVKDVIMSTTRGDGDTLTYHGAPYINDRPHHKCPYRAFLNRFFPFIKTTSPMKPAFTDR